MSSIYKHQVDTNITFYNFLKFYVPESNRASISTKRGTFIEAECYGQLTKRIGPFDVGTYVEAKINGTEVTLTHDRITYKFQMINRLPDINEL